MAAPFRHRFEAHISGFLNEPSMQDSVPLGGSKGRFNNNCVIRKAVMAALRADLAAGNTSH